MAKTPGNLVKDETLSAIRKDLFPFYLFHRNPCIRGGERRVLHSPSIPSKTTLALCECLFSCGSQLIPALLDDCCYFVVTESKQYKQPYCSPLLLHSHNLFPSYKTFLLNMLKISIWKFSPYQQDQRQRERGRERKRASAWAQEREKHHCFEPGTKEISAPTLGDSVVVTDTSLMTKASVYLRARLWLHFASGRKQTDSKMPTITCNQTGDPSPPEPEQTVGWSWLPQKSVRAVHGVQIWYVHQQHCGQPLQLWLKLKQVVSDFEFYPLCSHCCHLLNE